MLFNSQCGLHVLFKRHPPRPHAWLSLTPSPPESLSQNVPFTASLKSGGSNLLVVPEVVLKWHFYLEGGIQMAPSVTLNSVTNFF